jgi:predicted Zn-dependent peptidase
MSYKEIAKNIHLITQSIDRKAFEIEIIYSCGGSIFEQQKDRGKKHLLEHCIASRTSLMNFESFKNYQFRENININAYTGPLTMGLEGSGHYSDVYKTLDNLLEMTFLPTFDSEILAQEKEIVLREISERRGDPNYRLYYVVANEVFTSDSYITHEVLGDSQMVAQTNLEDFSYLHSQNLQKSQILICLSGGGFEANKIEQKILSYVQNSQNQEYLKTFQNYPKNPIDYHIGSKFKDFSFLPIVSELGHSHSEVTLYLPCKKDFYSCPAQKIFEELYLKYHGKIYDRLRNQLGLIYSMSASFDLELQQLAISFACEISHIKIIIQEIQEIFSGFEKNFDEKMLQEFKQILYKKIDISKDSARIQLNHTVNSLREFDIAEDFDDYIKRINQVSKQDIKEIYEEIAKNFNKKRIVVVSKDKTIEKSLN